MIYRPYKVWKCGLLTESWEPYPFATHDKIFCRLDCPTVNPLDSSKTVFIASYSEAMNLELSPCSVCKPSPGDRYLQCLICGSFLPTDRGMEPLTCRCGDLSVDFSAPNLWRVISASNNHKMRHVPEPKPASS